MYASFAAEQTEGEVSGDGEGCGLDARLVAILDFVDLYFEVLTLTPSDVHAHEHLGPILRLGSTRARMDGDDRVERGGFAGEHGFGFELLREFDEGGDLSDEIRFGAFAF